MATVELTFSALPAHVRTARLVATAIARRTGVAEAILDEVRLAVGRRARGLWRRTASTARGSRYASSYAMTRGVSR